MGSEPFADQGRLATDDARETALDCLAAGIEAALPETLVDDRVAVQDGTLSVTGLEGRLTEELTSVEDVVLVGGGNAAGGLAAALAAELGDWLSHGVVVTDEPSVDPDRVEVRSGTHPMPSATGVEHTQRVLAAADAAGADDLVIAVITGGASALLAAPADPLTVDDLRATTAELLACGASIDEINAVRKHCSAIKGGQLARTAAPARVCTLAISDVVGDDPSVIGSGPTVPDPSSYTDAQAVCERYDLTLPDAVEAHLAAGSAGGRPETPSAADPCFARVETHLLGSNWTALAAAREVARSRGYEPLVLSSRIRGEAREAAVSHVAIAEEIRATGTPVEPPAVVLSGGETTVTLGEEPGAGGPNQEFVTSAGLELDEDGIVVASVDTDGIDATDAAGAMVDTATVPVDDGRQALDANDVTPCLEASDALIRTEPTGTNVNDLRVVIVPADS